MLCFTARSGPISGLFLEETVPKCSLLFTHLLIFNRHLSLIVCEHRYIDEKVSYVF